MSPEWCAVVQKWGGKEAGTIPHRVLVELGIATEEQLGFHWTPEYGMEWRTIWFRREDAERIRAHPEFREHGGPE